MVIRISADKPGSINFSALLRRGRYFDAVKASGNNTISMFASCGSEKGIRFCTSVRVLRRPRFGVQFAQALIETGVEITTVLDKEDCMLPYDVI